MNENARDVPGVITHPPLIYLAFASFGALLQTLIPIVLEISLHRIVGIAAIVFGFSLSAWSVVHFFANRVNPDPFKATTAIVSTGPYRFSRNPIYIAFALMQIGAGIWSGFTWIVIATAPALATIFFGVIKKEERYLLSKFGAEYRSYCERVRRWV